MSSSELTASVPFEPQPSPSPRPVPSSEPRVKEGNAGSRRNGNTENRNGRSGASDRFARDRNRPNYAQPRGGMNRMMDSPSRRPGPFRGPDMNHMHRERLRAAPSHPPFQQHQNQHPPPPPPPPRFYSQQDHFRNPSFAVQNMQIPGPPPTPRIMNQPYPSIYPPQPLNPSQTLTTYVPLHPNAAYPPQSQSQTIPPPPPPPRHLTGPSYIHKSQGQAAIHNTSFTSIPQNMVQTFTIGPQVNPLMHSNMVEQSLIQQQQQQQQQQSPSYLGQYSQLHGGMQASSTHPQNSIMHDTRTFPIAKAINHIHPNFPSSQPYTGSTTFNAYPGTALNPMTSLPTSTIPSSISQPETKVNTHSPSSVEFNPENVASNWSTHTAPSGVYYYFNSVTQLSTYTRPLCLPAPALLPQESTSASSSNTTNIHSSLTSSQKDKKNSLKWTEYVDPSSGKKYYYDGTLTTWDKPQDYIDSNESTTTKKRSGMDGETGLDDVAVARKKVKQTSSSSSTSIEPTESLYQNKAEAMTAFKGMLLAKGITPVMKWNEVVKLCLGDSRWEACPMSVGERKQALAEYQAKRLNEMREEKRMEKIRAKDAFMTLLVEVIPSVGNGSGGASSERFIDVKSSLIKDDRYFAVEEESEREEIFYEFIEESRKREERQRRNRRRDVKESFIGFLKSQEDLGVLTFASSWSSFMTGLDDAGRSDSRFVISAFMSDSDRQLYFADYVLQLQNEEDEKKRRIRDARRRAEKAQRDAFRDLLRSLAGHGKITPSTEWRHIEDVICAHESFGPVQDQDIEAPRELFEDFICGWSDGYRRDKSFISHLCATSEPRFYVTNEIQYEDFSKALLEMAGRSPDFYSEARRVINHDELIPSAKLYFDEMKTKLESSNGRRHNVPLDTPCFEEGETIEDGEVKEVV